VASATFSVRGNVGLPLGWPIYALFLGFPIWWALGLGGFIWPVLAVPMAFSLFMRGEVRAPRGFGLWLLFLIWVIASATQLDEMDRFIVFAYRLSIYLSATILFLFAFNLLGGAAWTRRLILVLCGFWLIAVIGGLLGVAFPQTSFRSITELVMPAGFLNNSFVRELVHPELAQIQGFLGYPVPRPKAPFVYTNEWGANIALLTPFAFAAWGCVRTRAAKWMIGLALVASVIPIVVSLNRGLWLSLGVGLGYAIFRLVLRGRVRALGALLLFVLLGSILALATPLQELISDRLATPHSNRTRFALYEEATESVLESPLVGFGAPRPSQRNPGAPAVGTHGQFWMVLVSQGIPGAVLFVGWLGYAFWRSRRAPSSLQLWPHVCLAMALAQLPYYGMLPGPIHVVMVAAAVAWRLSREDPMAPVRARAVPSTVRSQESRLST
jgi:O-antigen ligase